MRRAAMLLAVAVAAAACGDPALETPSPSTTAAGQTSTTAVATTTAPPPTVTTAAPAPVVLAREGDLVVTGTGEVLPIANGSITLVRPRIEIPGDPDGAAAFAADVDAYLDGFVASATRTDELNPGPQPNEFAVAAEVTFLDQFYLSIRFEEYYGVMAAAHPTSAVTGMMWLTGGERVTAEDVLSADGGPPALLAMVEADLVDEMGDTFGARIHLDDMVLTPTGLEVTVDEHDGIPHVYGRVTLHYDWADLDGVVDATALWPLIREDPAP